MTSVARPALYRHCEAEGRGNPSLPTTAAWIASFLAMTEACHCEAEGRGNPIPILDSALAAPPLYG